MRSWTGKDPGRYNSIINKTPLTARTNRIIGGSAPSGYLVKLAKSAESTPEVGKVIVDDGADAALVLDEADVEAEEAAELAEVF